MATGVLVLGIGRATRLLGHLALTDKAYDATIRLGVTRSPTTPRARPSRPRRLRCHATDERRGRRRGADRRHRSRCPPSVSAIKVDGERAYKRVREGEDVELPPRPVTVSVFDVLAMRRDGPLSSTSTCTVECSTGTYVRALARDLGCRPRASAVT